MALFTAFNCALDANNAMAAGTSYASGAKCAIQLSPPASVELRLVEWGVSFNGNAAGTPAVCTLVQMGTALNMTTGGTSLSGLVKAVGDRNKTTSLTMGTSNSAYGVTAVSGGTGTMQKQFAMAFVGPTSQYEKQFPLGRDYVVDASTFCQLRINTAATLTAFAYIVFEEI